MSNRLLAVLIIMLATTALSYPCFAQTYGTPGYAPGAWKPEELPKDLSQTKKFDPRDLTGVWVVNVDRSNHERHSLTDAPDNGLSNFVPPSLTPWGQEKYAKNIPSYGPRKVMPGLGNDP